ncbi:hypothetical protein [Prochlorococcus marinus]|nr:hypothetical protein [Prochlorococcus marinus]
MKFFFTLVLALSISTAPLLAWGWGGDGDCPHSKENAKEQKTEQVEDSDQ